VVVKGSVVVVTGASAGIGAGLARELAERGASLVLTARREPELRAVADSLKVPVEVVTSRCAPTWSEFATARWPASAGSMRG